MSTKHLYRPIFRPVSFSTMPPDVQWDYISRPASFQINRPELPQSRYPYGEIALSRLLTLEESDRYGLVWFDEIQA